MLSEPELVIAESNLVFIMTYDIHKIKVMVKCVFSKVEFFFSSFASLDYNVKFMVEVENYTKFSLNPGYTELEAGQISEPPAAIFGGEIHGVVGHKTAHVATGCAGVLSWEIAESDEKLVLMYSIPYSQDFHSNWIGVGLYNKSSTPTFDEMYYGYSNDFNRKDFYDDIDPVSFSTSNFAVEATCGTNHKPTIKVKLTPTEEENLDEKFKKSHQTSV